MFKFGWAADVREECAQWLWVKSRFRELACVCVGLVLRHSSSSPHQFPAVLLPVLPVSLAMFLGASFAAPMEAIQKHSIKCLIKQLQCPFMCSLCAIQAYSQMWWPATYRKYSYRSGNRENHLKRSKVALLACWALGFSIHYYFLVLLLSFFPVRLFEITTLRMDSLTLLLIAQ